jgi:hypothetical protein
MVIMRLPQAANYSCPMAWSLLLRMRVTSAQQRHDDLLRPGHIILSGEQLKQQLPRGRIFRLGCENLTDGIESLLVAAAHIIRPSGLKEQLRIVWILLQRSFEPRHCLGDAVALQQRLDLCQNEAG